MSAVGDKQLPYVRIDPTEYDVSINAILIGIGAEKYINIFKKHNVGQCTLAEFSDEDLIRLGVDDAEIREKIQTVVKNLPIYIEAKQLQYCTLDPLEIIDVLDESTSHLYRMYLSMVSNTLALKKTKGITDCLLHNDRYASNIAMSTLSEMNNILNSMEIALHKQIKVFRKGSDVKIKKKILVGTIGSVIIAGLSILFVRSLKQLK